MPMKLTIFTPTYNREKLLSRTFKSLQEQTSFDFEWLIVDDGSTDGTEELCREWVRRENLFPIRYYKKENGGKCSAINDGLDLARGEWFLVLDSDDFLAPCAVEKISEWVQAIPADGKFCAIGARATYGGQEPDSPVLEGAYQDCSFFDRYPRKENGFFFIGHDRIWIFKTDVHRKYKYPVYPGEKFMTEAVSWNRMAHEGYRLRCYNEIIGFFEHQGEGLTDNSRNNFLRNPRGYGLWLSEMARYLKFSPSQRFKQVYTFYCDTHELYSKHEIASYIHASPLLIASCAAIYRQRH